MLFTVGVLNMNRTCTYVLGGHRSVHWTIRTFGADTGIRTQTWGILSPLPLPLRYIRRIVVDDSGIEPLTSSLSRKDSTAEIIILIWCRYVELNYGHIDFQSTALPPELYRHIVVGALTENQTQVSPVPRVCTITVLWEHKLVPRDGIEPPTYSV